MMDGDLYYDIRTLPRSAGHLETPSDAFCALAHEVETVVPDPLITICERKDRVETTAIIVHHDAEFSPVERQAEPRRACGRMAAHIRKRFLDDPEQLDLSLWLDVCIPQVLWPSQLGQYVIGPAKTLHVFYQGGAKALCAQPVPAYSEQKVANLGMSILRGSLDTFQVCGDLSPLVLFEGASRELCLHLDVAQHLSQAIMQLLRQPVALDEGCQGSALFDDLRLCATLFSHVAHQ